MSGTTDLAGLLKGMRPELDETCAYAFLTLPYDLAESNGGSVAEMAANHAIAVFREAEGLTLVLSDAFFAEHVTGASATASSIVTESLRAYWRACVEKEALPLMSHITMRIHSSLTAVGFTAAFSRALTDAGVSCNVFAGYFHDHIFVPEGRRTDAMSVLTALSSRSP